MYCPRSPTETGKRDHDDCSSIRLHSTPQQLRRGEPCKAHGTVALTDVEFPRIASAPSSGVARDVSRVKSIEISIGSPSIFSSQGQMRIYPACSTCLRSHGSPPTRCESGLESLQRRLHRFRHVGCAYPSDAPVIVGRCTHDAIFLYPVFFDA